MHIYNNVLEKHPFNSGLVVWDKNLICPLSFSILSNDR